MEIEVLEGIFDANEIIARENRALLDEHGTFMVNLMASPGGGKTSVIVKTLERLPDEMKSAVIEGDVAGKVDAERIGQTGTPAIQINTGGSCHLEAKQVNTALEAMDLEGVDLVMVENVGNLVCPAEFKIGENFKARGRRQAAQVSVDVLRKRCHAGEQDRPVAVHGFRHGAADRDRKEDESFGRDLRDILPDGRRPRPVGRVAGEIY